MLLFFFRIIIERLIKNKESFMRANRVNSIKSPKIQISDPLIESFGLNSNFG